MKWELFLASLQHFSVITDHNPLTPITNNHCLDEIDNSCLQRLKTKLMAYNPVSDPENADTLVELNTNGHPDMSLAEIKPLHGDTIQKAST